MPEKLAIIKRPQYGVNDRGSVSLRFTTYFSESAAADHDLYGDDAAKVFLDANVSNVDKLDGLPCYVNVEHGIVQFIRVAKI